MRKTILSGFSAAMISMLLGCGGMDSDPSSAEEQEGTLSSANPTCQKAGGKCGALTATGLKCEAGYTPNASAGTCLIGAGCCMPQDSAACAAKCPIGCPDPNHQICGNDGKHYCNECVMKCHGADHAADPKTCGTPQPTCEKAGGKCGALTALGVKCEAGYTPNASVGTCLIGASCCIPQPTCEKAGGKCGALTASGVKCEAGYTPKASAGICLIGASCCMPEDSAACAAKCPIGCPAPGYQICGNDGKHYCNECVMKCHGAERAVDPKTCG